MLQFAEAQLEYCIDCIESVGTDMYLSVTGY